MLASPSNGASFEFVRTFLHQQLAIHLGADKDYLIESRLTPVLRKHELADFGALVLRLRRSATDVVAMDVLDAMTTNETSFFREPALFDTLVQDMLPALMRARGDAAPAGLERRLFERAGALQPGDAPA